MRRVFADTYFLVAILSQRDAAHKRALEFIASAEVDEIVTTIWVLAETADTMNRLNERKRCAMFIEGLRNHHSHMRLVEDTSRLFWRGFDLYRSREDKEWSLTDCISFVVMADEQIHRRAD